MANITVCEIMKAKCSRRSYPMWPMGQAMVIKAEEAERVDGLCISPVEVMEKEKIRVVHDLILEGPRTGPGGKPRRSVNTDTNGE